VSRPCFNANLALLVVMAAVLALPVGKVRAGGGRLQLTVVDEVTGEPVACRIHLKDARGRPHRPRDRQIPFWHDHFVIPGQVTLNLPRGNYAFDLERGPEYRTRHGRFTINDFADDAKQVTLQRCVDMAAERWFSGDLDIRRRPDRIELLMQADDLHVAPVVTWGTDIDPPRRLPPEGPVNCFQPGWCWSTRAGLISRAGTELLLFGLEEPISLPKGGNGEYPPTIKYLLAKPAGDSDGGAAAPASNAGASGPWIDIAHANSWDLPLLVAHGLVDSIEVANGRIGRESIVMKPAVGKPRDGALYPGPRGYARWIQDIYFRLLECGLRIPPSAGSGSGVQPNPLGYNRVYVHVDSVFSLEAWWANFRRGRVTVTNGPLLRPTVEGHLPGHVFQMAEGDRLSLEVGLTLSTREPISYLEIIQNGRAVHSLPFEEYAKSGRLPLVEFDEPGWFLVRVITDLPNTHRFAMTAPWYVEVEGQRRVSREAAQFFLDWVYERARTIDLTGPRRDAVIDYHRAARDFWQRLVDRANAE